MAYDKVIDSEQLEQAITATADAIRNKLGITNKIEWREGYGFAKDVGAIESEPIVPTLQDKTITENGTYNADPEYDGLGTVTVNVTGTGGGSGGGEIIGGGVGIGDSLAFETVAPVVTISASVTVTDTE